jgi:hypothetical protein
MILHGLIMPLPLLKYPNFPQLMFQYNHDISTLTNVTFLNLYFTVNRKVM